MIPDMPTNGRSGKLMIRVSDEEKAVLDKAAANAHLSTATWGRSVLLREAHGTKAPRIHTNGSTKRKMELLSLFCGPGGLDYGFKRAGFSTRIAFDIDKECVATFNHNHAHDAPIAYQRDLRELTMQEVFALTGDDFAPMGVIGGPPCQSFSVSNVFQSENDPRHDLPAVYAQLLKDLNAHKPLSFFLFENVPGLLGPRHIHRYEQFKAMFAAAGFEIYEKTLDAMDFGIPQQRERIFIVGINRKLHPNEVWNWPVATTPEKHQRRTVRQVLSGLPEPIHNEKGLDPGSIPFHRNHWTMVPRSKKFTTDGMLEEGQAWGRSFRTLAWDEPSWTVAYGNREVHVHPSGKRRLSIYEAMRLQSFPSDYELTGNISAQVRLVSEAVAPEMAFLLALSIRSALRV